MNVLVPFVVAVPFICAAIVVVGDHWLKNQLPDLLAIATAATTMALAVIVLVHAIDTPLVYWFGGWEPKHGIALGVSFTVDAIGAGLATLVATLVLAAVVFSWRYFEEAASIYYGLLLLFLSGMCGFVLSGDIFNMFVFFELMSTAALALTGYAVKSEASIQGAFNFGVMNGTGAIFVLFGIALLYGTTGALNLAQIVRSVDGRRPTTLLVVAFSLLATGFLIKAAAVPFHFWLADAYAVAPAPVCALLAGVMSDLGVYAIARIFWTIFAGPFAAHAE